MIAGMPACCAVGCTNRPGMKKPGVSFHRFPKAPVLRAAWIVACRRKDWLPSSISTLCSEHFSEDLIDRTNKNVMLKENAIPNIFKDYAPNVQIIHRHQKLSLNTSSFASSDDLNDDEIQSNNESISETAEEIGTEPTGSLNSSEEEPSVENVLPVSISESPRICLPSTTRPVSINDGVIQLSNVRIIQTPTNSDAIKQRVSLNSPMNKSSFQNRPPVLISESPRKCLPSTARPVSINDGMIQLSNVRIIQTPTNSDAIKRTVSLNSSMNVSSFQNRPQVPISESPRKCFPSTARPVSINDGMIQLSNVRIMQTPTNSDAIKRTVSLNSPMNVSSFQNRPRVPISENLKLTGYRMAYTCAKKFFDREEIDLSDDSISETASDCDVMEASIGSNSPTNESSIENMLPVRIPVVESDCEDYPTEDNPTEDLEKIFMKRKLEESNNLLTLYRKKIKFLQQKNRRLKQRLDKTKRSLNILKKTNKALFL